MDTPAGVGVDAHGGPVIDPTANVTRLVVSESKRQDDLRLAAKELSDVKHAHQSETTALRAQHNAEVGKLREEYQEKIQHAESGRLDSIRQVDREEVAKTAVAANTAITTLAKQTNDLAVTLAKTVADTAAAAEARNSAQYSDTNKRLSALELSSSEGKGKQQVADPAMERLTAVVEAMARAQQVGAGHGQGMSDSAKLMIALLTAVTLGLGIYTFSQRADPAIAILTEELKALRDRPPVYYTAPNGTLLPSQSPPSSAPR